MKQTFTLLGLVLISLKIFAGQGGPDTWGYMWKDSNEPGGPVYNWIDIAGEATEVKLLADDNSRGPFPINFDFHYYWYDVNQFWVGSNGYLLFQNGNIASPFPFAPSTAAPNDVLGAFMNDLTFGGLNDSAVCYYRVNPAKDTLIVSWINVPYFDTNPNGQSGNNTFQIILSKVDSSITFQYKEVTPTSPYSGASSVGIENYSGSIGLWFNGTTFVSPPANFAIKFYPPQNPTLVVHDAAIMYLDNPETGAIFLTNTSSTGHNLTTQVKNTGTVAEEAFNVQAVVKDPAGVQVVSNFFLTNPLASQESQTFTFTQQLNPNLVGLYKYFTVTQLPGDYPPQNNSKTQEIVVVDPQQPEVRLSYDAGQLNQITSINWIGGSGGIGSYFIPPFYPAVITKLHYYNTSTGSGFSGRVFDDDGVSGLPYTMFDSVYVQPGDVVLSGWTDVELPNPITITSGGFYVSWDMQGELIALGMSIAAPFSNRSFEVFNDGWGIYRYRETQDPLINVTITEGVATGINSTITGADLQMSITPNPASDHAMINYKVPASSEKVWLVITDLQGKIIGRWNVGIADGQDKTFSIDTEKYAAGMYLVELYTGKSNKIEKMVITD